MIRKASVFFHWIAEKGKFGSIDQCRLGKYGGHGRVIAWKVLLARSQQHQFADYAQGDRKAILALLRIQDREIATVLIGDNDFTASIAVDVGDSDADRPRSHSERRAWGERSCCDCGAPASPHCSPDSARPHRRWHAVEVPDRDSGRSLTRLERRS